MNRAWRVELLKGEKGTWYWRLKAGNGKVLAHSETYSSRLKARKTAWAVFIGLFARPCVFVENYRKGA